MDEKLTTTFKIVFVICLLASALYVFLKNFWAFLTFTVLVGVSMLVFIEKVKEFVKRLQ